MVQRLMEKLSPVINTHAGREKSVRIMQYLMMFLIPTLQNMKGIKNILEKLNIIKSQMSLTRKVMRFGMQIPLLLGVWKRIK